MTTAIATRLGNTFIGAVTQPARPARRSDVATQRSIWRKLGLALFHAPGRLAAWAQQRQAERDALIRYAMNEGRELGLGRSEIERAVLLTGRADLLFPSYWVTAHRR